MKQKPKKITNKGFGLDNGCCWDESGDPIRVPRRERDDGVAFVSLMLGAAQAGQLDNLMAAATPGGIERQEKRGQMAQTQLQTLPRSDMDGPMLAALAKLGFKLIGERDALFNNWDFPAGWKKVPTSHSMYSDLVDDKGRVRGSIGYKAVFYDQWTSFYLTKRYQPKSLFLDSNHRNLHDLKTGEGLPGMDTAQYAFEQWAVVDAQTVEIVKAGEILRKADYSDTCPRDEYMKLANAKEAEHQKCVDWLNTNLPDWKNAAAYWE